MSRRDMTFGVTDILYNLNCYIDLKLFGSCHHGNKLLLIDALIVIRWTPFAG